MKKFLMIFGLSLMTGIGVFALTESMASENLMASVIPHMGCGCETCGETCDCSGDKMCGDEACSCGKVMTQTCSGDCTGGTSCSAASGEGSCAAMAATKESSPEAEVKTVSCGCGKISQS